MALTGDVVGFDGPVLAVDLGASRIRAAVVDSDGRILARAAGRTPLEAGPSGVVAAIVGMLRHVREAVPADVRERIGGVGISAPGPVDPVAGVLIEPPNLGPAFRGALLADPIGRALSIPAAVDRDTHVAALAEWEFGAARGELDFLYLTVSTGIGGAIVTDGRLMIGPDGLAGELGHVLVELDGPPCACGGRGHLEAISSGVGIARAAAEAIASGRAAELAARARRLGRGLDARDVADAEVDGDLAAAAIMDRARHAFAESCASLVDVFTPALIVVGGSIARNQGDLWLDPARERIASVSFRVPRERVRVVPAELGDDVGLVGALPLLRLRRG
jgi:glucokinase